MHVVLMEHTSSIVYVLLLTELLVGLAHCATCRNKQVQLHPKHWESRKKRFIHVEIFELLVSTEARSICIRKLRVVCCLWDCRWVLEYEVGKVVKYCTIRLAQQRNVTHARTHSCQADTRMPEAKPTGKRTM